MPIVSPAHPLRKEEILFGSILGTERVGGYVNQSAADGCPSSCGVTGPKTGGRPGAPLWDSASIHQEAILACLS